MIALPALQIHARPGVRACGARLRPWWLCSYPGYHLQLLISHATEKQSWQRLYRNTLLAVYAKEPACARPGRQGARLGLGYDPDPGAPGQLVDVWSSADAHPIRSGRRPKGRNCTFLGRSPSYTMRVTEADDCSAVARIFSAVISS